MQAFNVYGTSGIKTSVLELIIMISWYLTVSGQGEKTYFLDICQFFVFYYSLRPREIFNQGCSNFFRCEKKKKIYCLNLSQ